MYFEPPMLLRGGESRGGKCLQNIGNKHSTEVVELFHMIHLRFLLNLLGTVMLKKFLLGKSYKIKCPDGSIKTVYRDVDDAFPLNPMC